MYLEEKNLNPCCIYGEETTLSILHVPPRPAFNDNTKGPLLLIGVAMVNCWSYEL
jgi:hypothetical protein